MSIAKKNIDVLRLVGKKIARIVGQREGNRVSACAILFDDGETFLTLAEQDTYNYHDCATSARIIYVYEDRGGWDNLNKFEDATELT